MKTSKAGLLKKVSIDQLTPASYSLPATARVDICMLQDTVQLSHFAAITKEEEEESQYLIRRSRALLILIHPFERQQTIQEDSISSDEANNWDLDYEYNRLRAILQLWRNN